MKLEEGDYGDNAGGRNVNSQFVLPDREPKSSFSGNGPSWEKVVLLLDVFREAGKQVLAIRVQTLAPLLVLVRRVYDGCMEYSLRSSLRVLTFSLD